MPPHRHPPRAALPGLLALALVAALPVAADRLALEHVAIDLPGPPATVIDADLDGDGRRDLAVVVAFTGWEQIGIEGRTQMDEVAGMVETLTIIPALVERRELHLFFRGDDGYRAAPPVPLERNVLSLLPGPPAAPLLALTDDGVARLRAVPGGGALFEPLIARPPALARSQTFVPGLELMHDVDGDGRVDLLLPVASGYAVHLATAEGLAASATAEIAIEPEPRLRDGSPSRRLPLPEVRDVTGDGLPELLYPDAEEGWRQVTVHRNLGGGRFAPGEQPLGERIPEDAGNVVHFGDLDGDGQAEVVLAQDLSDEDAGFRQGMAEAKLPPMRYALWHTDDELAPAAEPYRRFAALGHAWSGSDVPLSSGLRDLDGDGRSDLVALGFDFSLFQAVRVLSTHRLSIEIDFLVWCQRDDGDFARVEGLDLSGKLKLDLDDLRFGRLSQFAGDFDGDGRIDFVQLGRGRDVGIHRGRDGCAFAPRPDLTVRLEEEPADAALAQVRDLDGDGRADLLVIQPRKASEAGVTPPARLDLYLSGAAR